MLQVFQEGCLAEETTGRNPDAAEEKQRQAPSHEGTIEKVGLPPRKGDPKQMSFNRHFYLNGIFYVMPFVITNIFILFYP